MEMFALLTVFVAGYLVSWIQWYQPEQKKAQALAQELFQAKASQQEYPRATGWKAYQNSLEQESDLAQESARQWAEQQQWKQW
jgi:hypothetical protein